MRVWRSIQPRDRRALAIGSVVVASALCLSFVVRPLFHAHTALRDRLHEQRGLLARELGLIAATDRLPEDRAAAADALASVEERIFPYGDPLAATAALVKVVGEEARRQGVLLEAIETGAPEATGGVGTLVAVRIDVRGRGDFEGLLRWLKALEGSRRLLQVEQLSVARAGAGGQSDSADVEVLTLAATVRGYVLAGADGGGPATNVTSEERRN
jgi:type II secretory pathway component PulM